MSVELATLTGLKNDLRTFGAATKEITGTAGEALSKGDSFYIGTDGNFYKTASAAESVGTFSLDQQTGLTIERDTNWQVKQATNSNGWIAGVLWRHYGSTNVGSKANNIFLFVINPSNGNIALQQIWAENYQNFNGSGYYPYARTTKDVNIQFYDDTHIWVVHDENSINRDSNNNYSSGLLRFYSKVYTLDETTGATTGIRNESDTLTTGQTTSSSVTGGYGYSVFWPGRNDTFFYKAYTFGQHYGAILSLNSTYNLSKNTLIYNNNQISQRSSDHYSVGYHHDKTNNRSYLFSLSNPSASSYYYATGEQTLGSTTGAPNGTALVSYGTYSLIDNLYVGYGGNYTFNSATKTNGVMKVFEIDWTSSTAITWTEVPMEIGNFPFPKGVSISTSPFDTSRNFPWLKIGSDYYFVAFQADKSEQTYEDVSGTTRSYTMYNAVVCKLTKDVPNSKYVLDFVCVLDDATSSFGEYPFSIFKDASNNIKVMAYRFDDYGGTSGGNYIYEVITYDITPYIASGQAGASVNGVIKADVASGATATGIIEGQLADIAVPVGTSLNGWTGIGNNQAVKG